MKTLFELSLLTLTSLYRKVADHCLDNGTHNGYILTNVLDECQTLKADSQAIYIHYISNEYSHMFDVIYRSHERAHILLEIYM